MRKMQSLVLACVSLASILVFTTASAGNRPGAATVTVGGGYEWFTQKRKIDNTGLGLIQLGWDFTQNWGVTAMYAGFNTNFKDSQNDNRSVSGSLFTFNGVYHFPVNEIFQPFVMFGVGITGINPAITDANNEGNINAGLGAQVFVHKSIAFQVEGRDLYTLVGGKNDFMLDAGISALFDFC